MMSINNIKEIETAIDKNNEIVLVKDEENNIKVMSLEEYNQEALRKDIEKHLLMAEDDFKNGRVYTHEQVGKMWSEKYGI